LIGQYVDTVLYIAKHNFTHKDILDECLKQLKNNHISSVGIVANDVSIRQSTYRYGSYVYGKRYGYGNSYGYGYGNNYDISTGSKQDGYTED
jgi:tyrosine-protein kinase Etk/Wzc